MKFGLLSILASSALLAPQALAAFTVAELHTSSSDAVADFIAANPDHADHLVGYKTWKSGENAKVKIYVTHGTMNMEFDYLCHKHDGHQECHAQH